MKLHEVLELPNGDDLTGFYVEIAPDGVFLRTAQDQLVARMDNATMTFYDMQEVNIYELEGDATEAQEGDITLLLDTAWGREGFSREALEALVVALDSFQSMYGEGQ